MSTSSHLLVAFKQRNVVKFQEALEVHQADPNYFVETENETVFEIILRTPNSSNFIKLCIENGAEFYMKSSNGHYPLHRVVESRCLDNLKQVESLFTHTYDNSLRFKYSPHVNVKLADGQNSLHVLAGDLTNENYETIFGMMRVLLSYGCNPNYPNYDGKTAFFILLERLPKLANRKEILDYFLENANIDFYTHRGDEMVEFIMNEKPKFELPQREPVYVHFYSMKELLTSMDVNRFEALFPMFTTSCADAEIYADNCSMFLEIAVEKSLINIVDLLIDNGVDINKAANFSNSNLPPTCMACATANPGILHLFLVQPNVKLCYSSDGQRSTLLHHFFDDYKKISYSKFRRSGSQEMSSDQKKCFDMLMAHSKWNRDLTNSLDTTGLPGIYYSVIYNMDYITLQLLQKGANLETVLPIIRRSLLEEFLNNTISTNDRFPKENDYEIKIDYNFLVKERQIKLLTHPSQPQCVEEMNLLKMIAENAELIPLLAHPTIASFILLKWQKVSFLVYINLVLIVLFMVSFIPFTVICPTTEEDESCTVSCTTFQVFSLVMLSFMILRELSQAMLSVKQYVLDVSNWVDIVLMTSAITSLLIGTQLTNHSSRLLRTLVILLATAEYFNVLGIVPIFSVSIYTKMFRRVCSTFVKSMAFYSVMIIAFAFSFHSLQGDKFSKDLLKDVTNKMNNDIPATNATRNERFNNFYTVGSSLIKTFVMLTGELEGSYVQTEGYFYALLFVVFIFLVTIVLYNLLNALAVSDTQEIKRDAKLIDLLKRIETMQASEAAIFKRNSSISKWLKVVICLFPKSLPDGHVTLKPNRGYEIYINEKEPIISNQWLNNQLKFLKYDIRMTINGDIMEEIFDILHRRSEEKSLSNVRQLKENRNTKLANDVIRINELVTKLQADFDLYKIRKQK